MKSLFQKMWADDAGFIVSAELLLIFTITVLGLVVGLANMQSAILHELTESAQAIMNLNQTYATPSYTGCTGLGMITGGSSYNNSNAVVQLNHSIETVTALTSGTAAVFGAFCAP